MQPVVVEKGYTVILPVSLGFNVSEYDIISRIRVDTSPVSDIIVTWITSFDTDGKDGEIVLMLPYDITEDIVQSNGYMNIVKVGDGPDISFLNELLEVEFVG